MVANVLQCMCSRDADRDDGRKVFADVLEECLTNVRASAAQHREANDDDRAILHGAQGVAQAWQSNNTTAALAISTTPDKFIKDMKDLSTRIDERDEDNDNTNDRYAEVAASLVTLVSSLPNGGSDIISDGSVAAMAVRRYRPRRQRSSHGAAKRSRSRNAPTENSTLQATTPAAATARTPSVGKEAN